jgi:hypothetical protein
VIIKNIRALNGLRAVGLVRLSFLVRLKGNYYQMTLIKENNY